MSSHAKWVGDLPAAAIDEQAYLVSRGVRPLALLGSVDLDADLNDVFVRLNQLSADWAAIPFVLPRQRYAVCDDWICCRPMGY